ncbi:hypothetical protein Pelo_2189 [Pelomyxa schiedti]|nr:hypothetical protein Pelo_2189 [Pelomyxa schiedti]
MYAQQYPFTGQPTQQQYYYHTPPQGSTYGTPPVSQQPPTFNPYTPNTVPFYPHAPLQSQSSPIQLVYPTTPFQSEPSPPHSKNPIPNNCAIPHTSGSPVTPTVVVKPVTTVPHQGTITGGTGNSGGLSVHCEDIELLEWMPLLFSETTCPRPFDHVYIYLQCAEGVSAFSSNADAKFSHFTSHKTERDLFLIVQENKSMVDIRTRYVLLDAPIRECVVLFLEYEYLPKTKSTMKFPKAWAKSIPKQLQSTNQVPHKAPEISNWFMLNT